MMVIGAKRIIFSKQNHGGGLQNGYIYNGKKYKGSDINTLPEGIYWGEKIEQIGKNPIEHIKILNSYNECVDNLNECKDEKRRFCFQKVVDAWFPQV